MRKAIIRTSLNKITSTQIRRAWLVAGVIGLVSAMPVILNSESAPWLIAVPLGLGAILVAGILLGSPKK